MFNNQVIAGSSGQGGGFYDFPLEQSLRFNDDDNAYLSRTPASAGNRKTWTFSCWVKRGKVSGTDAQILTAYTSASDTTNIIFQSGGAIQWYDYISGYRVHLVTNALYRDVGSWYHLLFQLDTSNATSGDRAKIYVNGERVTSFSTEVYPSLNADLKMNTAIEHRIGDTAQFAREFDGYMAEVNFVDGSALEATSFGELKSGIWIPKDPTGLTYGNNGFRLNFADTVEASGFNALTWTGDAANPKSVNGCGFSPDFVWAKARSSAFWHRLYDSVRGANKALFSNATSAETTDAAGEVTSFDSDGFTFSGSTNNSNLNNNGTTYVAWCWDAGSGSPVSNTDGSITSTVKANTDYGFSVTSYVGTGANATVGHGLTTAPELIFVRNRSGGDFKVYSEAVGNTYQGFLNDPSAFQNTGATIWNNTSPTSSVFSLGTNAGVNQSGANLIAYAFHSVTGYSRISTYTGTGAAGNSITLGFKPAFLLIKEVGNANSWELFDNTRNTSSPFDKRLFPNDSAAEATTTSLSYSDTGFETLNGNTGINRSGGTYIYMAFADTRDAAFWRDVSGQGNDWQPNNLTFSDVVPDSATNNFPTIIKGFNQNVSEGNLKVERSSNANNHIGYFSTMGMKTGKWYAEVRYIDSAIDTVTFGVAETNERFSPSQDVTAYVGGSRSGISANTYVDWATYGVEAKKYSTYNGTNTSYGVAGVSGDIFMLAVDMDNNKFWIGKNGTWMASGNPAAGTNPTHEGAAFAPEKAMVFVGSFYAGRATDIRWNFGQDSTFMGATTAGGNTDANGYGDFKYAPPSGGFLALCSANLPSGAIDTLNDETPEDYFNTVLWTGDNTNNRSITGVGFQPSLVSAKSRSGNSGFDWVDAVRGGTKNLQSNNQNAEATANTVISFDSDGFTVGDGLGYDINKSGESVVGWSWKANGAGVSNTDGSITSTVSVGATSQQSWFSIVDFTGAGSPGTVGHGLGVVPSFIVYKRRNTGGDQWVVYHDGISNSENGGIYLNLTNAWNSDGSLWNNTAPTSSVFSVGTYGGGAENRIAYCFANAENMCKVGTYVGNGSTDGSFIYTGFRPSAIIGKNINDGTTNWWFHDDKRLGYNANNYALFPNLTIAEDANVRIDMLSNGFKLTNTAKHWNTSGQTFIYLAIASQPLAFANAR